MSFYVLQDSTVGRQKTSVTKGIPVTSVTEEFPHKGAILYDIDSEINDQDGIIYFADGKKWSSIIGGTNLTGGNGISIVENSGFFTINNSNNIISSAGVSLVGNGGAPMSLKGLTAGTGILLTQNANDIVISTTNLTLSSVGGGSSLVFDGTGPDFQIKSLTSIGGSLKIDEGGVPEELDLEVDFSKVTLSNIGSDTGNISLTTTGTTVEGPNLLLRGIAEGPGISITEADNTLTINTSEGNFIQQGFTTSSATNDPGIPFIFGYGSLASPTVIPSNAFDIFVTFSGGGGGGGGGEVFGAGGGQAGALVYKLPAKAGETLMFAIGSGGNGGIQGLSGATGGQTSVTLSQTLAGLSYGAQGGAGGAGSDFGSAGGNNPHEGFLLSQGAQGGNGSRNGSNGGNGGQFGIFAGGQGGAAGTGEGGGGGGASYLANGGNGGEGNDGVTDGGLRGSGGGGSGDGSGTVPGGVGGDGFVILEYKLPL